MKQYEELKTKLKEIFDWQKANVGDYKEVITTDEGLSLEVEYDTSLSRYAEYEFDWHCAKPVLNKEERKTLAKIGLTDDDDILDHISVYDLLTIYLKDLKEEIFEMYEEFQECDGWEALGEAYLDFDDITQYDSFDDLWEVIQEHLPDESTDIRLNDKHTATITKGSTNIQVGCQTFDINVIRNLVDAWDEVNG